MDKSAYDLWHDANSVGGDLVVETWISNGPRAGDPGFDPRAGDWLLIGDDAEPPVRARVVRRNGDRVSMQLDLRIAGALSGAAAGERS